MRGKHPGTGDRGKGSDGDYRGYPTTMIVLRQELVKMGPGEAKNYQRYWIWYRSIRQR